MPSKGMSPKLPVCCHCRKRPPISHLTSASDSSTIGAWSGPIHIVTFPFHLPTKGARCSWWSPGWASFIHAAISACISGVIAGMSPSCWAGAVVGRLRHRAASAARAKVLRGILIVDLLQSGTEFSIHVSELETAMTENLFPAIMYLAPIQGFVGWSRRAESRDGVNAPGDWPGCYANTRWL